MRPNVEVCTADIEVLTMDKVFSIHTPNNLFRCIIQTFDWVWTFSSQQRSYIQSNNSCSDDCGVVRLYCWWNCWWCGCATWIHFCSLLYTEMKKELSKPTKYRKLRHPVVNKVHINFLNKKQILTLILKLPKSFYPWDCKFVCPKADFNVIKLEQRQIKRQISIHLQADWCEPNKRCFKSNDSINSEGTEKRGIQRWNCSPELRKKNCV